MYIYTFLLRMADTMTSQNVDLSSWDSLCISVMQNQSNKTRAFKNVALVFACKEDTSFKFPILFAQVQSANFIDTYYVYSGAGRGTLSSALL
jgi:hypothetical protein